MAGAITTLDPYNYRCNGCGTSYGRMLDAIDCYRKDKTFCSKCGNNLAEDPQVQGLFKCTVCQHSERRYDKK